MPQSPLAAAVAKSPTNVLVSLKVDADGNLLVAADKTGVDSSVKLNMVAANVIKATKGVLKRVIVIAPGTTSGAWTLNDCATTGAATAANTILNLPFNASNNVAGAVINLDIPCAVGIVLSAVPGAGSPILAAVYE